MEASLLEISVCAKFQVKIRNKIFSKIWGPTRTSIWHSLSFVHKMDEILTNPYQSSYLLARYFHFILFSSRGKIHDFRSGPFQQISKIFFKIPIIHRSFSKIFEKFFDPPPILNTSRQPSKELLMLLNALYHEFHIKFFKN
jgi:hypothetical protein